MLEAIPPSGRGASRIRSDAEPGAHARGDTGPPDLPGRPSVPQCAAVTVNAADVACPEVTVTFAGTPGLVVNVLTTPLASKSSV